MMKSIQFLSIATLLLFSGGLFAQDCEKLIWSDEFDGDQLNEAFWNYEIGTGCPDLCGWGNNEQQYYTQENVSVENGIMTITAKEEAIGGMDYTSARISTKYKADFKYGRFEARMRLPETQGMWPAFWMLPTENVYGIWPRSGEIDIMELIGHEPNNVLGTLHTGLPWQVISDNFRLSGGDTYAQDFHTFSIEWSPDTIKWFMDDLPYHQVTSSIDNWAPFQEDFHIILNIAVGGNLPGFVDSTTVFPQVMEVDYVRVYNTLDQISISGVQPTVGAVGQAYSAYDIADATYIWSVPSGSTITSGQGTNAITVDWGCDTGNVVLELQTDCGTEIINYTVDAFLPITVEGSQLTAQNQNNLTFSTQEISGATYNWVVPAGASITAGQGTNNITVDWGCAAGQVTLDGIGACGAINASIDVNLETYSIAGSPVVPPNAMDRVYSFPALDGATYAWTVPTGVSITAGAGTNEITVNFGNDPGLISVDVTNSCGTETYELGISINSNDVYCTFDGIELSFGTFGGAEFEKIANPFPGGINTSDNVGIQRKVDGAMTWGGIFADLGGKLDFDKNPYIHMKVYAPRAGTVLFKLEDPNGGTEPVEFPFELDIINEWVDINWDLTDQPSGTFDRIALFFDFGNLDTSPWYFDDIIGEATGTSGTVEGLSRAINVYPNPATDLLTVSTENIFSSNASVEIQLIQTDGKVVLQETKSLNAPTFDLNLSGLNPGAYFMRIKGKNSFYIKQIIKMN